ncbi:SHOCT domain-containing protein [Kribbella qitaiheensis]|uniref:SHOCT domain-containing protein n=1 Tax=Kribbella qitaiheensis TaxID=1544730 RepID=A0A7G6WSM3_9ACTN|nr:SHOCT domain-containing protein [Kribbella qitaiheensis]QNE16988.1 SHOCT domain-containing protein [Kribbella qitaiheensis]
MTLWHDGSMSGWGYVLVITGLVVFVSAVVFGAIAWARFTVVAGTSPVAEPAPELLLALRLADGTIEVDDYERRLDALHDHYPAAPTRPHSRSDEPYSGVRIMP